MIYTKNFLKAKIEQNKTEIYKRKNKFLAKKYRSKKEYIQKLIKV